MSTEWSGEGKWVHVVQQEKSQEGIRKKLSHSKLTQGRCCLSNEKTESREKCVSATTTTNHQTSCTLTFQTSQAENASPRVRTRLLFSSLLLPSLFHAPRARDVASEIEEKRELKHK